MTRRPFLQSVLAMLWPWSKPEPASKLWKVYGFNNELIGEIAIPVGVNPCKFWLDLLFGRNAYHETTVLPEDGDPALTTTQDDPKVAASVEEALRELMEDVAVMKGEKA